MLVFCLENGDCFAFGLFCVLLNCSNIYDCRIQANSELCPWNSKIKLYLVILIRNVT
jgi:hypothetical protein